MFHGFVILLKPLTKSNELIGDPRRHFSREALARS
ncbi:unnamed protein product [Spirodela intermedia]|uniref:Uncharacterized protein n=2 Tax=Spirodela intermedia TaxID=51605 RepID=A0A7I8JPV9_SPIIN|nr:unnamed protein product [Spirodela intermedia]CAA6672218.1 unnamed protein product [Spirodela intermedia]CAA7409376.1 unnamed protein product [Spirodela intermedia]